MYVPRELSHLHEQVANEEMFGSSTKHLTCQDLWHASLRVGLVDLGTAPVGRPNQLQDASSLAEPWHPGEKGTEVTKAGWAGHAGSIGPYAGGSRSARRPAAGKEDHAEQDRHASPSRFPLGALAAGARSDRALNPRLSG